MKTILPGLAAILLLGCLMLGYFALRQKNLITELTRSEAAADKVAQDRISNLQQQLTAAQAAAASPEKAGSRAVAVESAARPALQGEGASGGTKTIHLSDIMKDHPEYVALYIRQMRRNVDRAYGDSLNTLNLAPAQLSQLKDLLAERQMNNLDAQGAAEAAGLERNSPAWQEAMKRAAQETEQQITALVGDNARSILQVLQARGTFQAQVESTYKYDFVNAGVPLSPEQSTALVQALSDANYTGRDLSTRPPGYNDSDPATGLTPHEVRILNSVAHALSPAQLQIVRTDLVENRQTTTIMHEYTNTGGGPVVFVP